MRNKLQPTLTANAMTGAGEHGTGGMNIQTVIAESAKLQPTLTKSTATLQDMEQAKYAGNSGNRPEYKDAQIHASTSPPSRRPASRQVALGSGLEHTIRAGSGRKLLKRWKLRNPDGASSRTQMVSSLLTAGWHTKVSVVTWRERVIGSRVLLYLHQRSAPGTEEIEFGLLPTLRSRMTGDVTEARSRDKNPNLEVVLAKKLLRTLAAADSDRGPCYAEGDSKRGEHSLVTQVAKQGLLPTLTKGNITGGNATRSGDRKDELLLPGIIKGLAPTLTTRDWKDTPGMAAEGTNPDGSHRDRNDQLPRVIGTCTGYRLSSSFAAWWMGYPLTILTEQDGLPPLETL
jgi:hypothetical protein